MTRTFWRGILLLAFFWITPASAQAWMSASCTVQNGERIFVLISQGEALIFYNDDKKPHVAFPQLENEVMSVVHIASTATFIMSIEIRTGRAYTIMSTDRGRRFEYNAICKIDIRTR